MEIIRDKSQMQRRALELRQQGKRLGFVPTMGALHAGHLSLMQLAGTGTDVLAASIFVNPTQFGPGEDLERYPRDLAADAELLESHACDMVFAPSTEEMYDVSARTHVEVDGLGAVLCGVSRPGHFRGVATVVCKLLHILQPDVAAFGLKDAQQAIVLRRMVRDLDIPVELRFGPTVRDADGLALSSRNRYLSRPERAEALLLQEALRRARGQVEQGERDATRVRESIVSSLRSGSLLDLDYAEIVETENLTRLDRLQGGVLIAVAAHLGATRLIDNSLLWVDDDGVRDYRLESVCTVTEKGKS